MHNPNLISGVSLRARQHIAKALAVGALSFVQSADKVRDDCKNTSELQSSCMDHLLLDLKQLSAQESA